MATNFTFGDSFLNAYIGAQQRAQQQKQFDDEMNYRREQAKVAVDQFNKRFGLDTRQQNFLETDANRKFNASQDAIKWEQGYKADVLAQDAKYNEARLAQGNKELALRESLANQPMPMYKQTPDGNIEMFYTTSDDIKGGLQPSGWMQDYNPGGKWYDKGFRLSTMPNGFLGQTYNIDKSADKWNDFSVNIPQSDLKMYTFTGSSDPEKLDLVSRNKEYNKNIITDKLDRINQLISTQNDPIANLIISKDLAPQIDEQGNVVDFGGLSQLEDQIKKEVRNEQELKPLLESIQKIRLKLRVNPLMRQLYESEIARRTPADE